MSALPDLDSLKLLVDVGELGSLGRAARAAGIAQPSASKRIALLERRLGLPCSNAPRAAPCSPPRARWWPAGPRRCSPPPRS
ncbi:LysR family transcriptional regulator [Nonomuraea rubra]|uniref:helix-turn-helix domain-containing protein n=1 Tax=Nonomuraea rubra TaxID=46180 RepID=UPI003620B595